MDLIGPLPETPRRNKYIVTLTDYFSKWAEAAALPNKSAVGIAKFIFQVYFSNQTLSKMDSFRKLFADTELQLLSLQTKDASLSTSSLHSCTPSRRLNTG